MNNLPESIQEYVNQLNQDTQEKALKAIEDLRQKNMPWLWIQTALNLKPKSDWEKWGFGLMFSDKFKAQVDKKHDEAKRAMRNDSLPQAASRKSITAIGEAQAYCMDNADILLSLLGCGSWEEVKSRIAAIKGSGEIAFDATDAPHLFYFQAYSDGREPIGVELPYDVSRFTLPAVCDISCFKEEGSGDYRFYHTWALHYDCRNADAIRYALKHGHIPAESKRDYIRLLEKLSGGEHYEIPVVYCRR